MKTTPAKKHSKPAKELQSPSGLKPLAKVRDVSDYLNAPASTIYSLCYRGELPFFRVGKSYRFDMEAIRLHVTGA